MIHLFCNQYNWLLLYAKQPLKSKVRKLYLSRSEVVNFLNEQGEFLGEKKNALTYKLNNTDILVHKDRLTIGGMSVLLTKPESATNETTQQNQ